MQLILIDGGPASGKNTLGKLLIDEFHRLGNKAIYSNSIKSALYYKDKMSLDRYAQPTSMLGLSAS